MKEEFNILEATIKSQCGQKPVYYFPNPGNWGDALIRHGTIKFLNEIGLKYRELPQKKRSWLIPKLRGGTVIYGGGGGWCNLWNHSVAYVKEFKKHFNVIVLPSTYESDYSDREVAFFTRDKYESSRNMPEAIFCHDMAFYIGDDFLTKNRGSGKGYFFRSDAESSKKITLPPLNNDISATGRHTIDVSAFFEEIDKFEVVYTDRLHVAIAGCLLRKEVHLYLGSYFKNRAIHLSSMQGYFPNSHFHDDYDL